MTGFCSAAVFDRAGEIEVREVAIPEPRGSEVLVRIEACTICGSDSHTFQGRRNVPAPTVLGHEIVGEIAAFGDAPPSTDLAGLPLRIGDRVTWAIVANCGVCLLCSRGLPQKCARAVKYGHEAFAPGRELLGGLADYCLLVPGTSLVRLPDDLPLAVACPANCATATVVAALEAAGELRDRRVAIFGAGMLGLTACAMASTRGADVVCLDPTPAGRELALAFGAKTVGSPEEFTAIADGAVGAFGFDVLFEFSGDSTVFALGLPRLRLGGRCVLVGSVFPGDPVAWPLERIVRQHVSIFGIHNYAPPHLLAAVEFLAANHSRYPFGALVSPWMPLSGVAEAFARAGRREAIRIGIRPDRCLGIARADSPI